ncbi:unnamed protein product [Penicillium glandicola]
MKNFTPALAFASIISLVNGHGFVTSPTARMPGTAMEAACGAQVVSNQEADNYGNIQGELQVAATQTDYNAEDLPITRPMSTREVVDFTVDIRAPHTGVANVSVVATASNTVIGDSLIYWDVYASTATGVTANETSFSVTIPDDLDDQCATAGDCVLQWYWYAESIDQTYESCVDFTVGGSGSSASSAVTSATSSSAVVATTAASTSSASSSTEVAATTTSTSSTSSSIVIDSTTAPAVAVQSTTSATVAVQSTTTSVAVQPTTFATTARPSTTSAEVQATTTAASTDADTTALAFPTDSAADVLSWLEALFGNLAGN